MTFDPGNETEVSNKTRKHTFLKFCNLKNTLLRVSERRKSPFFLKFRFIAHENEFDPPNKETTCFENFEVGIAYT